MSKKTQTEEKEHVHESNGFVFKNNKDSFSQSIGSTITTDDMDKLEEAIHEFLHDDEREERKSVSLYKFLESKFFKNVKITLKTNADYFIFGYAWHAVNIAHDEAMTDVLQDLTSLLMVKRALRGF